jgi:hypothetical protein
MLLNEEFEQRLCFIDGCFQGVACGLINAEDMKNEYDSTFFHPFIKAGPIIFLLYASPQPPASRERG